jgi:hypothetical protein
MRRSMSDRVGADERASPPKGLDVMICLLARFRIGSEIIGELALWSKGGQLRGT